MLPEARGALPLPAGRTGTTALEAELERTRAARQRYRERLEQLYAYDLIRRNCVSEIFRTVDAALGDPEESVRRLGGHVDPVAGFTFIPFVSSDRVRASWNVAEHVRLPSYRGYRLAAMEQSEPAAWVALRESNVLTARAHRASEHEGFFLFFTDEHVLTRPLLGAINLGAGLARSAVGLVSLPLDRGRGLRSGLSGVAFSLPELLFQNIRKGYNDYVLPDERPPSG
jgi:hypothetical protein